MGVSIVAWGIRRRSMRPAPRSSARPTGGEGRTSATGRHRSACAASTPKRASPARTPRSVGRNTSGSPSPRISTYPVVHGPTPGTAPRAAVISSRSAPPSSTTRPSPTRVASSVIVRRRLAGIGSRAGSIDASAAGAGKTCVSAGTAGHPQRLAGRFDDASGHGPRAGHGDLLPDDRPNRDLERVDGARRTPARRGRDGRGERPVGAEDGVDGDRIGIEVEQPTQTADGRAEIAPVLEPKARPEDRPGPARRRRHLGHAMTVGQGERAVIRRAVPVLDPRDRPGGEEGEQHGRVERLAHGEIELDRARPGASGAAVARRGPQRRRRAPRRRPARCR